MFIFGSFPCVGKSRFGVLLGFVRLLASLRLQSQGRKGKKEQILFTHFVCSVFGIVVRVAATRFVLF